MILVGFGWCDGCCGCGCFLYGDGSAVVVVDRCLGDHEILIRLLERQATRGFMKMGWIYPNSQQRPPVTHFSHRKLIIFIHTKKFYAGLYR